MERIPPGKLKVLDDGIFNEPYATVSLALAAMAAGSASDRSAAMPSACQPVV